MLVIFNKPFRVLSQFSAADGRATLKDYIDMPDIYPAGRLDFDSEGLLVLTDDGRLQRRISDPRRGTPKEYLVQVEGEPDQHALQALRQGVVLRDGPTRPARIARIGEPQLWLRDPPIRVRRRIPTAWLRIGITEGRNRQVRRMTAHVGHPTLRLIRWRVGDWTLDGIACGHYRILDPSPCARAGGLRRRRAP